MGRKNSNARRKPALVPVEELVGPTDAQMARGGYTRATIAADDGRQAAVHINGGHDPVDRWLASGKIEPRQKVAIDIMRKLWLRTGLHQRVTATYGERTAGSPSTEACIVAALEAKEDLARIEGYFAGMKPWFSVFENVCRHGMQAGVAGSELGYGTRGNDIRAHLIVCFIADMIATRERL